MHQRRSSKLIVLGVAVFVLGSGLVFAGLRSGGGDAQAQGKKSAGAPAAQNPQAQQTPAGTQIVRTTGTGQKPTTFTIPTGKQAVAVELPLVPALAGYAKAGDLVNVYAMVKNAPAAANVRQPQSKLFLKAVRVLDVKYPTPGTSGGGVFLLALDEQEAEKLIFFGKFEALWMTLVPSGQSPRTTTGRTYENAF